MPRHPFQSVNLKCEAARDLPSGVTNSFLALDADADQYALTTFSRSVIDLRPGTYYRVTFREIEPPTQQT